MLTGVVFLFVNLIVDSSTHTSTRGSGEPGDGPIPARRQVQSPVSPLRTGYGDGRTSGNP